MQEINSLISFSIITFLIFGFVLFIIIFLAVRFAIKPLINYDVSTEDDLYYKLKKLQDIGVITENERLKINDFYWKEDIEEELKNEFNNHARVLTELKDKGYFSVEEYNEKMDKLNHHYEEGN